MYFVSVTRLRIRHLRFLPIFSWHNWFTIRQTARTPGFIGGKLLAENRNTYWTMTLWEKPAAMRLLRDQGAHKRVMPRINDWCDEAAAVHWEQASPTLPTFAAAHGHMVTAGHFTRLKNPAAAHVNQHIPVPAFEAALPIRPVNRGSAPIDD